MEFFEALLKLAERDPFSAVLVVMFITQWWRERDKERDDRSTHGAITLATTIVQTFHPLVEAIGAIAEKLDGAHTRDEETHKLIKDARQEHNMIISSLANDETGLGALAQKIDAVPEVTAEKVKTEVKGVVENLKHKVVAVALQLDTLGNQLDAWKPQQVIKLEPGESAPEASETKPEPTQEG